MSGISASQAEALLETINGIDDCIKRVRLD